MMAYDPRTHTVGDGAVAYGFLPRKPEAQTSYAPITFICCRPSG